MHDKARRVGFGKTCQLMQRHRFSIIKQQVQNKRSQQKHDFAEESPQVGECLWKGLDMSCGTHYKDMAAVNSIEMVFDS